MNKPPTADPAMSTSRPIAGAGLASRNKNTADPSTETTTADASSSGEAMKSDQGPWKGTSSGEPAPRLGDEAPAQIECHGALVESARGGAGANPIHLA